MLYTNRIGKKGQFFTLPVVILILGIPLLIFGVIGNISAIKFLFMDFKPILFGLGILILLIVIVKRKR